MSETESPKASSPNAEPQVFARAASGLVRDLSLVDALWFGVLASGLFFIFVYFFPQALSASPGINVPLMLVIATAASIPVAIAYAGLGSSMPRAGGDYLFQSRTITPWIGFAIPFGWAILLWTIFYPLSVSVILDSGAIPILDSIGAHWATSVATWLATQTGSFIATVALSVLAWWICVAGIGVYRRVQRWIFVPAIFITFVTLLVMFLTTSHSSYAHSFNSFAANKSGHLTVASVVSTAHSHGWHAVGYSLGDTLLWIPILLGAIPFAVFAAEGILGEVKGARNFTRLAAVFSLGCVIVGIIVLALLYWRFQATTSRTFLSAAAFDSAKGAVTFPYGLGIVSLSSVINNSTFVVVCISLGFIAASFQLMVSVMLNVTRVAVSMGLDRSMPSRFADVNSRTHTPVFGASVYLVIIVATSAWFTYNPSWFAPLVSTASISGLGILLFSCLAAFLLPIRARAVYESSPVSKYRIAGIPLIQLAGGLGFLILGVSWVVIMTNNKLGVTGAGLGLKFDPRAVVLVPVLIGLVVFAGWRWVERSRGVDNSLAFKAIPPE